MRLFRRQDGTVLTSDCPVGARRRHRTRWAMVGAAVAAVAGLFGVASRFGIASRFGVATRAESHSATEEQGLVEREPVEKAERIRAAKLREALLHERSGPGDGSSSR